MRQTFHGASVYPAYLTYLTHLTYLTYLTYGMIPSAL